MPQPKFLYFDMGNVLLFFSHERMAAQMAKVAGISQEQARKIVFESDLNDRFEHGTISPQQFYDEFCTAAGSRPDFDALLAAANDIFWINAPMVNVVGHLNAAGYRLGILSNTNEAHFAYVLGRFSYMQTMFAVHALSCRFGSMKPQHKVYLEAARLAGVEPGEVFFTDDRPENVAGARAAGFDAVEFVNSTQLTRELLARGVTANF
jgi:putative hydrolase of the HAD superfamily